MTTGPAGQAGETQQPTTKSTKDFDIVAEYRSHLNEPGVTKPVAAIQALVALLAASSYTTVFETLETVKKHALILRASVQNPLPLKAGTDLFVQYLVSSLRKLEGQTAAPGGGSTHHQKFEDVLEHLVHNSQLFVERAIAARDGVAETGAKFVTAGKTVMTVGASRTVAKLLQRAAERYPSDDVAFRVIYVRDEADSAGNDRFVSSLRAKGIPVAEIFPSAVAHVLSLPNRVDLIIAGAEAVTQSGGIISRLGTYQIAKLAKENTPNVPFYVAAETHKFIRELPLGQNDLGYEQSIVDFTTKEGSGQLAKDAVDYTHHRYVTNLFTENGVKLPSYVVEQVLDIYGTLRP